MQWYSFWEERGSFHADPASPKEPYVIVIPPPNVTGILTLGHVLNNTLRDILIRFEKMRGRETCWVPGTDHAGIATQTKVEAALKKELGVTRHDLGRENSSSTLASEREIRRHHHPPAPNHRLFLRLERERFTMDPACPAVREVFIRLYNTGLVYKGKRIINWCPKSRTAISDEAVEYKENAAISGISATPTLTAMVA